LYYLPNIIRRIKSKMRGGSRVDCIEEMGNGYKTLARKPEWKGPLG